MKCQLHTCDKECGPYLFCCDSHYLDFAEKNPQVSFYGDGRIKLFPKTTEDGPSNRIDGRR
jgi:hypothetical protein